MEYARIEATLVEAELLALDGRRDREPGSMFGGSYRPLDASGPAIKSESAWSIRILADSYLETQTGGSWRHKVDVAVTLFEQFLGKPTAISEITRDHIRKFIDLLALTPQRAAMRFPKLSLEQAVAANKARAPRPYPCIGANTIRDNHYAVLRALFGYACGHLDIIPSDPTERVKVQGATKKAGHTVQFEIDELAALFRLPLFTGCRSLRETTLPGNVMVADHQFWTPLLMLFSGARPSEIAQLAVTDIKLGGDYPSISILTEFDPDDPEDRPYVLAFKTENSRRSVPLHPMLVELGFAEYVGRMSKEPHARLFPDWIASNDPRKLYSGATWVRRFNEKLVPTVTHQKPKPSLYSLRHTFKTQMAVCRVPPQFQNKIMGHAAQGMDPYYLKNIPIRDLHEEISKVEYRGLDLSHLKGR